MQCEICGERHATVDVEIDGTKFKVCENCSRFGTVIHKQQPVVRGAHQEIPVREHYEEDILPDFAEKIRNVREKLGLSRKEFAQKVNERVGVIEQIESGRRLPNIKVAKKIEKQFNIRLLGTVVEPETKTLSLPVTTLGDRVVIKEKAQK